jgi:hypothetical protein
MSPVKKEPLRSKLGSGQAAGFHLFPGGARLLAMAGEAVHRDLRLTTPLTKGPDVEALQQALNKIARQLPRITQFRLDEDGKLGEETFLATAKAAFIMGLTEPRLIQIEKKHEIVQSVQRLLRRPGRRSEAQKKRGEERRKKLRKRLNQRPSLQRVRVTANAGNPHWGGSGDVLEEFVEPFLVKRGLTPGSGKRTPAQHPPDGSPTSDHLTTNTTAAARDFPTLQGEGDARALAKSMGFKSWQPNSFETFNFLVGGHGFQGQVLWGANINHGDHVHVGVRAT